MSADDKVPDERGTSLEAIFWGAIILVGLGAFLVDFGRILLRDVPDGWPIAIVADFQQTMFLVAIIGGGTTVALIAYAMVRFGAGHRVAPALPDVRRGQFMLGLFALGMTFLMVTTMFVGASMLAQTDEADPSTVGDELGLDREITVGIDAGQWFWRSDVEGVPTSQGERIIIPAETVIHLEITSADVVHSFAIQELGLKKDALPGQVNDAWFAVEHVHGETTLTMHGETYTADTYQITCAELCGKGHSTMTGTVYVLSPEDFEHWVEHEGGTVPESFHPDEEGGDGHDDEH